MVKVEGQPGKARVEDHAEQGIAILYVLKRMRSLTITEIQKELREKLGAVVHRQEIISRCKQLRRLGYVKLGKQVVKPGDIQIFAHWCKMPPGWPTRKQEKSIGPLRLPTIPKAVIAALRQELEDEVKRQERRRDGSGRRAIAELLGLAVALGSPPRFR